MRARVRFPSPPLSIFPSPRKKRSRNDEKKPEKRLITLKFNFISSLAGRAIRAWRNLSRSVFNGRRCRPLFTVKPTGSGGRVDGKRQQFWFATEKEAKAVTADRNQEQAAYGSKVNLDSEARLEAFRLRTSRRVGCNDPRCRAFLFGTSKTSFRFRSLFRISREGPRRI